MSDDLDELVDIGNALVDTIKAGTFGGTAIRCALASGQSVYAEVRAPAVVIAPCAIGFTRTGEGWSVASSEWPLLLHSAKGTEPDTVTELQFSMAVLAALAADPTLGGVVDWAEPLATDTPLPMAPPEGPPTMFRRTLRVAVNHNPE